MNRRSTRMKAGVQRYGMASCSEVERDSPPPPPPPKPVPQWPTNSSEATSSTSKASFEFKNAETQTTTAVAMLLAKAQWTEEKKKLTAALATCRKSLQDREKDVSYMSAVITKLTQENQQLGKAVRHERLLRAQGRHVVHVGEQNVQTNPAEPSPQAAAPPHHIPMRTVSIKQEPVDHEYAARVAAQASNAGEEQAPEEDVKSPKIIRPVFVSPRPRPVSSPPRIYLSKERPGITKPSSHAYRVEHGRPVPLRPTPSRSTFRRHVANAFKRPQPAPTQSEHAVIIRQQLVTQPFPLTKFNNPYTRL